MKCSNDRTEKKADATKPASAAPKKYVKENNIREPQLTANFSNATGKSVWVFSIKI